MMTAMCKYAGTAKQSAIRAPRPGKRRWRFVFLGICVWVLMAAACGGRSAGNGGPKKNTYQLATVRLDALPPKPISIRRATAMEVADAALDSELSSLPDARAFWLGELGSRIYGVEIGFERLETDNPTAASSVPLVLIHGLGMAGMRDFYPVVSQLSQNRPVLLLDLPGLGRSDAPKGQSLSPVYFAERVAEVILARITGPFDLLGHSLGGNVCLTLAVQPDLSLRRLIIVDAAGVLHREAFVKSQVDAGASSVSRIHNGLGHLVRGLGHTFAETSAALEPSENWMAAGTEKLSKAGTRAATALILHSVGPYIASITSPVLLIWGENDTVAPLRTGRLLRDRIAKAALTIIPDIGHVPMKEAGDAFVRSVSGFLDLPLGDFSKNTTGNWIVPMIINCRESGAQNYPFTGRYQSLEFIDCTNITIENAEVGTLRFENTVASLNSVNVSHGVFAFHSKLQMTGGHIRGETGLLVDDSTADVAGTSIEADGFAVASRHGARLLFSATFIRSSQTAGVVHDRVDLAEGEGF
ncbi:MAG: alpha/beta hydrolase [Deltaproteobacteria bacterium]|nr:alpha/beta hydrolase [Deltaproteobacteria bacterium]